jgi:hypothetical protein
MGEHFRLMTTSFMKTLLSTLVVFSSWLAGWATTINSTNRFAYGANIGWLDWRGDTNNGAVIGEYVCSGHIYAANAGWIDLGGGFPADGIRYQNNTSSDFGVNHDGTGNLSGYAWGANIGWIIFTNGTATGLLAVTNQPRVDLKTGKLSGYVYSANCGWIGLSNAFAHVQTQSIQPGADTDTDGIADAWELTYAGSLRVFDAGSDSDGDGVSDRNEYLADTSPLDPDDFLRITEITRGIFGPTYVTLLWTSKPTRCYAVQQRPDLDIGSSWMDKIAIPFPGASNVGFDDFSDKHFYRIRAFKPLLP